MRFDPSRIDQPMVVVAVVRLLQPDLGDGLDLVGPRRRNEVVQQG